MATSVQTPFNMTGNEVRDVRYETVGALPDISTAPLKTYNTGRYVFYSAAVWYCDGTAWIQLGQAGAGGPPSGTAGGDLTGSYPNPQIAPGAIMDADVNASAAIAQSKISGLTTSLAGKATTTTTVTGGNGLTGGGDLSANRTLDVGAGTGIRVNADDVAVDRTVTDTWYTAAGASAPPSGAAGGDLTGTYPNPQIAAGVIVDGDVNSGANIAQSKIATLPADLAARLLLTGGTLSGFLTLSADPTNPLHAATKQYVDLVSQGFSFKTAVRMVATSNITLSGLAAVDGVTPSAGDRVLAAGQSTASQNGLWIAAAGAWSRAPDADANGEIQDGTLVPVAAGTANADSIWLCTATGATPWVVGTSTSTWTKFFSVADLTAGNGLTKTGTTIDFVPGDTSLTVAADSVVVAHAPRWSTPRSFSFTGDATGTAASVDGSANVSVPMTVVQAPKWTNARTISLTGDVTGSASVDGSANVSIATTVVGGATFAKKFAADIPAGTALTITHGLNTRDIDVQVYRNSTPWDTVLCDVERPDVNNVTVRFATAVTAAQYRVVVRG